MAVGGALILAGVVFTERADPLAPAAGPGPEESPVEIAGKPRPSARLAR